MKAKLLSRVRLLATPWTAAYQAPPPMGFSGKSTGVGCHCLLLYRIYNTFKHIKYLICENVSLITADGCHEYLFWFVCFSDLWDPSSLARDRTQLHGSE